MSRSKKKKRKQAATRQANKPWLPISLCILAVTLIASLVWVLVRDRFQPAVAEPEKVAIPEVDMEGLDPNVEKVIVRAQKGVELNPQSAASWGELGMVYLAHDLGYVAKDCFAETQKLDPNNARWHYLHGCCLLSTKPQEAIPHLEKAAELCHDSPAAPRLQLIELLLELHKLDDAEKHLDDFLAKKPDNVRALQARARLALMRRDNDSAITQLHEIINKSPQQQSAAQMLAEALLRKGEVKQAEHIRKQALKTKDQGWGGDPYLTDVHERKTGLKPMLVEADLLFGKGHYGSSVKLLQKTLKDYPDSLWAKILLGRAYYKSGMLKMAKDSYDQALEQDPKSVEALFRKGVVLYKEKDVRGAVKLYREAAAMKPDFTMAHYNLGYCLRELKDTEGAIEAFKAAIRCEPDMFDGQSILAHLLMQSGRKDEARKHLLLAYAIRPNDKWVEQQLRLLSRN